MKKALSVTVFTLIVLIGSSFKAVAPAPVPGQVPNYTMVDITSIPLWEDYNFDIYALKVVVTGYLYEDNTQSWQSEYIVNDPDNTSIWNMGYKYWCSPEDWVTAWVYVKESSISQWEFLGALATFRACVTSTIYDNFLSLMSFSMFDVPAT